MFLVGVAPVFAAMSLLRPDPPLQSQHRAPLEIATDVRWLAIVTGAEPAAIQVSLAQDLELARETLGEGGAVLFGGGSRAFVQVSDAHPHSLRAQIGRFFDPRDRDVAYVHGPEADGPATLEYLDYALGRAMEGQGPLLLYMSGHGEPGSIPGESTVRLWGGVGLSASDLAHALDQIDRPVQLVNTTCFGGGFAEILFREGDVDRGPSDHVRCGVFATAWDEEASGCDPDPVRSRQESYGIHFFHALRGEDRMGRDVREVIDLDGDGRVNVLEAHTRARVTSRSFDVPTTTSERWLGFAAEALGLELMQGADTQLEPWLLEEHAVLGALGAALALPSEEEAQRGYAEIRVALENEDAALGESELRADDAYYALRIRLLERWPTLDDAWNAGFEDAIAREGGRIRTWLQHSDEARDYAFAQAAYEEAANEMDALRARGALIRRLVEAWDAIAFARALHAHGGAEWQTFERLRSCERALLD